MRACTFFFFFRMLSYFCPFRDLGHVVKQLKNALEKNRSTIKEKSARIKSLEERLAALGSQKGADGGIGGITTTITS